MLTDTSRSPFASLTAVDLNDVDWTGGLYRERFDTVAAVTVPHLEKLFLDGDLSHTVENFRIAAGEATGAFAGTVFGDGDLYKWLEAAACTAAKTQNAALLRRLEGYIALFSRAQQEDGYLSTKQIIGEKQGLGPMRQGDINDFEVYNMGHMFTSACLYARLTGRDSFLRVAERAAGYLKQMYAEASRRDGVKTAVCPSHYMGLIELYRTTGKRKYLDTAHLAVALRDSVKNGTDDNQDRLPLRQHRHIVGHAVRANYLYAGLADLYMEEGGREHLGVLRAVWRDLVSRKIYITGGCGALYNGASPYGNFFTHQLVHQAYGYEYQLPNITAYNETCASVGGVLWAWRMFLIEPKAEYMDMLERMMLNVNMAGISLDGRRFFYENMLERAKGLQLDLVWGQERKAYITSFCCPPNLTRTLAQSAGYAYASDFDGVWTGLYGANTARFRLKNGAAFTLVQETDYPFDGRIAFTVKENSGIPFRLHLRVPAWAEGALLRLGGETRPLQAGSYAELSAGEGFSCVLELPVFPRLTIGNGMIEEDRGRAAVEAGPLVYCVETADAPGAGSVRELLLPAHPRFAKVPLDLEGRRIWAYETTLLARSVPEEAGAALYSPLGEADLRPVRARLIPYFAWDNRGCGEMVIWMPLAWREA